MAANNPDQDEFDPSMEEPADDFSFEEESFAEGEPSEEEGWDKGFEEDGEVTDEADEPRKSSGKKGGLFNILLIAGAVLVGGGFIYMKVIAPSAVAPAPETVAETPVTTDPSSPSAVVQEVQADVPALPVTAEFAPSMTPDALPEAPATVPPLAEETVLQVTPEVIPEAPATQPDPQIETAAENTTANTPELSAIMKSQPPVVDNETPPQPSPIATTDVQPVLFDPTLDNTPDANTPDAAPVAPVTASGLSDEAAKSIEQKLGMLITRLDTFEGRIANLESGLHEISARPAATADMSEMNNAVKALEQKITALEKGQAQSPAAATPPAAETPVEKPVFVPAAENPSEPAPTATVTEPLQETRPVTATKAKVKTTAPAKTTSWVLRSAQPGSAMVSPKSGGDMKTLHVGESLSGIGRIISIEQKQGRWVVQGTQGSINQ